MALAKYGGATVSELVSLKGLEAENAEMKQLFGKLALENAAIKNVLSEGNREG